MYRKYLQTIFLDIRLRDLVQGMVVELLNLEQKYQRSHAVDVTAAIQVILECHPILIYYVDAYKII